MDYQKWKIKRWETPISDDKNCIMTSLNDDSKSVLLSITVERMDNTKWQFIFDSPPAYRNIMEEYRTKLWVVLDETKQRCGNTFIVENSEWLNEEPFLEFMSEGAKHYVICTGDDVIEVISSKEPKINKVGNGNI